MHPHSVDVYGTEPAFWSPELPGELASGDLFARRLVVVGQLGGGAAGVVYLAWHRVLERFEALKLIRVQAEAASTDRSAARRFVREAQAMARVDASPWLVPVYDAGEDDAGLPFLRMGYVPGFSVDRAVAWSRDTGPWLSWQAAAALMAGVFRGLAELHAAGFVHRDVKPSNVMLSLGPEGARVQLVDFGIARPFVRGPDAVGLTAPGAFAGTPRYMSPEQGRAEPTATPAMDLYAAGATFYELVTGAPMFDDEELYPLLIAHLERTPRPPRETVPDLPGGLEALLLACVEKQPEQRPRSAAAVVERMERLLDLPRAHEALTARLVELRDAGRLPRFRPCVCPDASCHAPYSATARACPRRAAHREPGNGLPGGDDQPRGGGTAPPGSGSTPTVLDSADPTLPAGRDGGPNVRAVVGAALVPRSVSAPGATAYRSLPVRLAATELARAARLLAGAAGGEPLAVVFGEDGGLSLEVVTASDADGPGSRAALVERIERGVDAFLADEAFLAHGWTLSAGLTATLLPAGPAGAEAARAVRRELAARARALADAAEDGEVRVDADLYLLCRRALPQRFRGPLRLADGTATYTLRPAEAVPPGTTHAAPRFVGREYELQALHGALGDAVERRDVRWVAVTGPTGTGKRRLVREFLRRCGTGEGRLAARGVRIDLRKASDQGAFLRALFGEALALPEGALVGGLEGPLAAAASVAVHGRSLSPAERAYVATLSRACASVPPAVAGTPPSREAAGDTLRAAEALAWWLECGPLADGAAVLALERYEQVAPSVGELVEALVDLVSGVPLLVVVVARSDRGDVRLPRVGQRLDLGPLSPDDTRRFLASNFGGAAFSAGDVETLHRLAGGTPFLLTELALAARTVERTGPGTLPALPPSSVTEVVLQRLAGLSPASRALLAAVAVAGEDATPTVLRSLLASRDGAEDAAEGLLPGYPEVLARRLVHVVRGGGASDGGRRVAFLQDIVRDVVYRYADDGLVRRLHGAMAAAIEAGGISDDGGGTLWRTLAHHHARAGDVVRAVEAYHLAAEAADARLSTADALASLAQAWKLLRPFATGRRLTPELRPHFAQHHLLAGAVWMRTGRATAVLQRHPDALRALEDSRGSALPPLVTSRLRLQLAEAAGRSGEAARARAVASEVLVALTGDDTVEAHALRDECRRLAAVGRA